MAKSALTFRNKLLTISKNYIANSFFSDNATGSTHNPDWDQGGFQICTGTANAPDITPGGSTVTLIPAADVPRNCRVYVTRFDVDVQGVVQWSCTSPTGVPYVSLQDPLGTPLVHLPFNAMRGISAYTFPDSDTTLPLLLGEASVVTAVGNPIATFTYNSATGVLTASAAVFPTTANVMNGTPVTVYDGTGKGQSGLVTASTSTTVTLSPALPNAVADHSSTAKDSVIAVWYQPILTYTDTTHVTLENAAGTPYVANALDNGYNIIAVNGAGIGQVRPLAANTTAGATTLSFALNTALVAAAGGATATLVNLTNESNLNGAVDMCVGDKWSAAQLNQGLQIAINLQGGTAPVGSTARAYVEGFFAP